MLHEALVEGILKRALKGGADFAELYVERSKKCRMLVRNGRLEKAASGLSTGQGSDFSLEKIEGVGQDLTWQLMGPFALGSPMVEMAELSFAGA